MARAAFEELMQTVGREAPGSDEVEIRGRDPVLPCRFPLGEAAAAAVAA